MIVLPGDIADQLQAANEDVDASDVLRGRRTPQPLGALGDLPVADRPGVAVRQFGAAAGDPQAAIAVLGRLALPDQAAGQRVSAGPLGQALGRRQGQRGRGDVSCPRK
jgi:hypothetical protein